MPTFRYQQTTISLAPGDTWAAPGGKETYHDTSATILRDIVAGIRAGRPWREEITARYAETNPWLYQIITSPTRDLFFRLQAPVTAGQDILDIGSGWGQIALPLARAGHAVTALEPTPERLAFIQAAAEQEGSRAKMTFIQAGFHEISFTKGFDLISCVGVLEWTPRFIPGDPYQVQLAFLRNIRTALKPGGRCYLGIENRMGLKYLLGARDDHTGQRNISVLDAALAAARHQAATGQELRAFTYTLSEYEHLFRTAGFNLIETHGAFPDYKLPQLILPCHPATDFNENILSLTIPPEHDGQDGTLLPDPDVYISHYRSLARMGLVQSFCPSFFFVLQ